MNEWEKAELKSMARARFVNRMKLGDNRTNRDWAYDRSYRELMNKRINRKAVGQRVANILKAHPNKDIATFNALYRNTSSTQMELDAICKALFGSAIYSELCNNHRNTWQRPVWWNEAWYQHSIYITFHDAHQSEDDPFQIAYNRSFDNVKRNIQTRTRPGKYLQQFFGDVLSPSQIKEWAEKQVAHATCTAELKFIENNDEDGWILVYDTGPHSCMKGDECVKVYCYPDNGLRLAYLKTTSGEIVARCIVRNSDDEDNHGYLRIYATEQRWSTAMSTMLEAAGYCNEINLDGVKIQRIEHEYDDRVMCPYIDRGNGGEQGFADKGDHLLLGRSDFEACNTSGWVDLEPSGETCDSCAGCYDEDDMTTVDDGDCRVCSDCLSEHYTYAYGRRYHDYYPNDDVIHCESNDEYYLTETAHYHDVYQCRVTEDWYHIDDLVTCDAGEYEGQDIHRDEAVEDHYTNEWYYSGDCTDIAVGHGNKWVPDEFVATCESSGETIDSREAVEICMGTQTRFCLPLDDGGLHRATRSINVYVHGDHFSEDWILENLVRCGDMLLFNTYYGNPIVESFEPGNVTYGEAFDGVKFEDMEFDVELAEAA